MRSHDVPPRTKTVIALQAVDPCHTVVIIFPVTDLGIQRTTHRLSRTTERISTMIVSVRILSIRSVIVYPISPDTLRNLLQTAKHS